MYSDKIAFNEFVKKEDVESLKRWLLIGFEDSNFDPFYLGYGTRSAAAQLQSSFAELESSKLKERFKAATIRATSEWYSRGNYKAETLKQLLFLAAHIQASGIVDILREHLESEKLDWLTSGEYENTVQYVIGELQGFAPRADIEALFKRLFVRDDFKRFAAQLFLGLCKCTRERYTNYVPRFLRLQQSHPEHYSMFVVMHRFVQIVPLETIVQNFCNLRRNYQIPFLKFLCAEPWSPCRLDLDSDDTPIIDNDVAKRDPSEPIQEFPLSIDPDIMYEVADHANDLGLMVRVLEWDQKRSAVASSEKTVDALEV